MRPAKKKQRKTVKKQIRKKNERKKRVPEKNKKKGWFSRALYIDSCTSSPELETIKHAVYVRKFQRADSNVSCKDMCEICRERHRQDNERKKDKRRDKSTESVPNAGEDSAEKQKCSNTMIKSRGSSCSSYINSGSSDVTQK